MAHARFSVEDGRRIGRATRKVERMIPSQTGRPRRYPVANAGTVIREAEVVTKNCLLAYGFNTGIRYGAILDDETRSLSVDQQQFYVEARLIDPVTGDYESDDEEEVINLYPAPSLQGCLAYGYRIAVRPRRFGFMTAGTGLLRIDAKRVERTTLQSDQPNPSDLLYTSDDHKVEQVAIVTTCTELIVVDQVFEAAWHYDPIGKRGYLRAKDICCAP